jgi:D-amino-acid oxidase
VATKTVTKQAKDGSWSFIIPRGFDGGTIVGGTKEPENWDSEPRLNTRDILLTAGQELLPYACDISKKSDDILSSWKKKKVIADVVGRRPTRHGGMRIEAEKRRLSNGEKKNVIHAYGAGGRGFEISWGVAAEVVGMVNELLEKDGSVTSKL